MCGAHICHMPSMCIECEICVKWFNRTGLKQRKVLINIGDIFVKNCSKSTRYFSLLMCARYKAEVWTEETAKYICGAFFRVSNCKVETLNSTLKRFPLFKGALLMMVALV